MPTRGIIPVTFVPRGVCDTVSGDNSPPGAMTSLKDLIPDPSTPNCFICRPANTVEIDFSTYANPPGTFGVITAAFQVDNIVYGLVAVTSSTFNGHDYPFAYNLTTGAFLSVSGTISTATTPTSQSTTGAWTPPQMTLTGIDLVLTHVGFPGGVGVYIGWFDLTTPTAPVWTTGNTATNGLPSVPQACQSFNNRTYFFCGNVAYYTDTLAITMTNSTQSFTVGDLTSVTSAAPLPVSTTSQGIIQGIIAQKNSQTYLITGDVTSSNLALNQLSSSVGTSASRSVVPTPEGVRFMANDGVRKINFLGYMSEPDQDLALPFIYAVQPSRVAAAFNSDVYRICVQNGQKSGSPYEDYWYHLARKAWTGPHSFQYDIAIAWDNDWILASNSIIGKMWDSFSVQAHNGTGSSFIENGTQMTWIYQPAPMTDLNNIYANCVDQSTIEIAAPAQGETYNFTAQDESNNALATAAVMESSTSPQWGTAVWGQFNWGASTSGLIPVTIPWNQTIVFNKLSIIAQGDSSLGFKISKLHNGYKKLNYLLN